MIRAWQREVRELLEVSPETASEYRQKSSLLVEDVNRTLAEHPSIFRLIGSNSLEIMYNNHQNHVGFINVLLKYQVPGQLLKVIVWVYRSYQARGFSPDYFPASYQAWIKALEKYLEPKHALEMSRLYHWLDSHHQDILRFSREVSPGTGAEDPRWQGYREAFYQALLRGDSKKCMEIASETINKTGDLRGFYLQVLQPSLYNIGRQWELGEVSVAREHLASAIVSRVMSVFYHKYVLDNQVEKGKAVVTSAPNEFHEIGALMVSDFLEMDGWEVSYLGANTPLEELLHFLEQERPFLLALSITLLANLEKVEEIIGGIKNNVTLGGLKIMVGGLAFNSSPEVVKKIGVDGYARDASQAVKLAREWWEEAKR